MVVWLLVVCYLIDLKQLILAQLYWELGMGNWELGIGSF